MTTNIPITKTIDTLVQKAKIAQLDFEKYNQEQVNEVITAVAWAICNPQNNKLIAELSVDTTNLGKSEDKIIKNRRKTLGKMKAGGSPIRIMSREEVQAMWVERQAYLTELLAGLSAE